MNETMGIIRRRLVLVATILVIGMTIVCVIGFRPRLEGLLVTAQADRLEDVSQAVRLIVADYLRHAEAELEGAASALPGDASDADGALGNAQVTSRFWREMRLVSSDGLVVASAENPRTLGLLDPSWDPELLPTSSFRWVPRMPQQPAEIGTPTSTPPLSGYVTTPASGPESRTALVADLSPGALAAVASVLEATSASAGAKATITTDGYSNDSDDAIRVFEAIVHTPWFLGLEIPASPLSRRASVATLIVAAIVAMVSAALGYGAVQCYAGAVTAPHLDSGSDEEKYRIISEFTYDWEFWLGVDNQYVFVSPSCERISGYPRQAFYENPALMYSIIHPDDRDRYLQSHRLSLMERVEIEIRIIRRDGEIRWLQHACRPIRSADGRDIGRRGSNSDITERRRSEARQRELQRNLRQAQKMEALGTLAGGIAHNFNNVLAAIMGYAQLSLATIEEGERIDGNLREIIIAAKRGAGIVEQILTFSRRSKATRRPLLVNAVAKETLKLIASSRSGRVGISSEVSEQDLFIKGDPTELHQVIMNLCANAIHALGRHGGHVGVTIEPTKLESSLMVMSGALSPGRYVQLVVSDTGHGIDPANMERVFDPFFSTKEVGKGIGLGLSIVHGIATGYGGGVDIWSRLNEGTRVTVYLPAIEGGVA